MLQDGMDNGTFLVQIIEQNEKMSHMVSQLLNLSKAINQAKEKSRINLSREIKEILNTQNVYIENKNIRVITNIENDLFINFNTQDK